MNKNIRNIVFDLGGVLVGLDGQRSMAAFDALGCERVSEYIRDHRTEDLFYRIEMGLITTYEFCEEVRQMTRTKASDDEMIRAWNALLEPPTAARIAQLQTLRARGYRLFLLSNTNDMHWQWCREWFAVGANGGDGQAASGPLFERVFLSYEMHLSKPDPQIFREVLREADLQAAETLFIDDNQDNIRAANALGISTFWNREIDDWLQVAE